jgi:transposase
MSNHDSLPAILQYLADLESRFAGLERANGELCERIKVLEAENLSLRTENTILFSKIKVLEVENAKLVDKIAILEVENTKLVDKTKVLEIENADLKGQLKQNSKNSDTPPSAEGYTKAPALPKKKGGVRGGKAGHEGGTLLKVATPDVILVHHAANCTCCGRHFGLVDVTAIGQKRQVFDMPQPKLIVTEHQQGVIMCCGQRQLGSFPDTVTAPVQYGTRIRALTVMLNTAFRMPFNKIGDLTQTLFGQTVNPNTIMLSLETVYDLLEPVMEALLVLLLNSKVVHLDETGMRVNGSLHWFHTACNELYSYIFVHQKRGKAAIESEESFMRLKFSNYVVHDCWKAYFAFDGCLHALCGAHLLRELTGLIEKGSKWAKKMHDFLLKLYHASDKGRNIAPDIIKGKKWATEYDRICAEGAKEEPQPTPTTKGKFKNTKGRNLLQRLVTHKAAVTAFATVEEVPFTNNCAEQNIRHVKIKQKVAMSFRTFKGAQVYARIQSFIATTRKLKQNTFQELCNLLDGKIYQFQST